MSGGECFTCFPTRCPPQCAVFFAPPLFGLPPPPSLPKRSNHHLSVLTIVAIVVSSFFFLLCFLRALSRRRRAARSTSFARATPRPNNSHDETTRDSGLEQGLINSIVMFNYKKGDGLVQVTECSVCLTEFRDDDTLRLLPNCTHAFHPYCIDTWLESHVNCPLCRAGVAEDETPQSSSIGSNRGPSDSAGRIRLENTERSTGTGENQPAEAVNDPRSASADFVFPNSSSGNGVGRAEGARGVRSAETNVDLGDNNRSGEYVIRMMDDSTPRARTSLSIELSSSSPATDNRLCMDPGGSSRASSAAPSTADRKPVHRQNHNRITACSRSSILHKRPISMKRSSSTARMLASPRHGRRDNYLLLE